MKPILPQIAGFSGKLQNMIHLRGVRKKSVRVSDEFPFNVPVVLTLSALDFSSPVTFLVGENGSGKSTFIEALAAGANAVTVGREDLENDETLNHARELSRVLTLSWNKKTQRGFFLRAEDFFNFARRIEQIKNDLQAQIERYEEELVLNPRDAGIERAIGYMRAQKMDLVRRYGHNLDHNSHGESFMKLFEARLAPKGLYFLDEPEAALSPVRQLSLISILKQMIAQDCQFIIATHSPILMAFPDAQILSFDTNPISDIEYDEVEHVRITRAFLSDPEAFLRRL